jgi:hypothetical protein
MYMRISSVLGLALLVTACGSKDDGKQALAKVEAEAEQSAAEDGRIPCAVSGATVFARVCQLEQNQTQAGLVLTVRHPDGGFRRLQVVKDGRGVVAADGADAAIVTPVSGKEIEVTLAGDHYRIPATVKAPAPAVAGPATKS